MDALAFVLGERITALRVKEQCDLIHLGRLCGDDSTSHRHPITASVSAIFEVDVGSEVTFKRIMSNRGSEYLVEEEVSVCVCVCVCIYLVVFTWLYLPQFTSQ